MHSKELLNWNIRGYAVIKGELLDLMDAMDNEFQRLFSEMQPQLADYPNMMDLKTIGRLSYLHNFPQHATFAAVVSPSNQALEVVAERGDACECLDADLLDGVQEIMTPAACFHIYPELEGCDLEVPVVRSIKARCFRREQFYEPLRRQWNFNMREFVALGDHQFVENFINNARAKILGLLDLLEIESVFVEATDPFFKPEENPRYAMQKLFPTKLEIVCEGELAIASINRHRNYFGEVFDIRHLGELASSACVAFGLERWLSALITAHGPELSQWVPDLILTLKDQR